MSYASINWSPAKSYTAFEPVSFDRQIKPEAGKIERTLRAYGMAVKEWARQDLNLQGS